MAEGEYSALQRAFPGEFPATHAEFAKRVKDGIAEAKKFIASDDKVEIVEVKVADFLAWCAKTKVPPNKEARMTYVINYHANRA